MSDIVTDVYEIEGVYAKHEEFHVFAFLKRLSRKVRRFTVRSFDAILRILPESVVYTLIIAVSLFGWTAAIMIFYGSLIIAMSYGFFTFMGILIIWCLLFSWRIQRLQQKLILRTA